MGLNSALNMSLWSPGPQVMDTSVASHNHLHRVYYYFSFPWYTTLLPFPYLFLYLAGNVNSILFLNKALPFLPPQSDFVLNNVLAIPSLICNILYHQFTRDNSCSIKFDALGFYVQDFPTRHVIIHMNSSDDIYTFALVATPKAHANLIISSFV